MQGPYEKKLLHHLLDKYNVLERPVSNESEPIQISFGITLMQIIDVVSASLVKLKWEKLQIVSHLKRCEFIGGPDEKFAAEEDPTTRKEGFCLEVNPVASG